MSSKKVKSKQDHINQNCARIFRAQRNMKVSKGKVFDYYQSIIIATGLELATLVYDAKRAEQTKLVVKEEEV